MRAPPVPVSFGSSPPVNTAPANGYNTGMSYPSGSMGGPIDLVNPTAAANFAKAFPSVPPVAKKEGPRGIGFDDPDDILPQANLDRSSRTMPHDFIAPGLPRDSLSSQGGADYSEMKNELLDQQNNRIRGSMVKADEVDKQDSLCFPLFFLSCPDLLSNHLF